MRVSVCLEMLYCKHKNCTPASVTSTVELERGVAPVLILLTIEPCAEEDVAYFVELHLVGLKPSDEVPSRLDHCILMSKLGYMYTRIQELLKH